MRDQPPPGPPPFPPELARCRCGTTSFDTDDHTNACPLGPTPPLSTNPSPSTRDVPEWQRPF